MEQILRHKTEVRDPRCEVWVVVGVFILVNPNRPSLTCYASLAVGAHLSSRCAQGGQVGAGGFGMSPLVAEDAVHAGGRRVRRRFGRSSSGALGLIGSCLLLLGCRLLVLAVGFSVAEDFAPFVLEAPGARWTSLVLLFRRGGGGIPEFRVPGIRLVVSLQVVAVRDQGNLKVDEKFVDRCLVLAQLICPAVVLHPVINRVVPLLRENRHRAV